MITAYYDRTCDSKELFKKFEIGKSEDFEKYLNKYDVIQLDMAYICTQMKSSNDSVEYIHKCVIEELKEIYPDILGADDTIDKEYDRVVENFDKLIAQHGYVREGEFYRVERPNRDTIAFFCHFGLECVLLSRLMNVSPMILWHHTSAAPTSVTSIYTEERRKGIASFRVNYFGDISHLYIANQEPSFSARFCETYDCEDERHD